MECKFAEAAFPFFFLSSLLPRLMMAYRSFFLHATHELRLLFGQRNDLSTFVPEQEPVQNISESRKILHLRFARTYMYRGRVINLFTLMRASQTVQWPRWVQILERWVVLICRCLALAFANVTLLFLLLPLFLQTFKKITLYCTVSSTFSIFDNTCYKMKVGLLCSLQNKEKSEAVKYYIIIFPYIRKVRAKIPCRFYGSLKVLLIYCSYLHIARNNFR